MSPSGNSGGKLREVFYLAQNTTSLIGVALTTASALTLIAFWFYFGVMAGTPHPYLGILVFVLLPALFAAGLLLIALGVWFERRSLRARGELKTEYPAIDFAHPTVRRAFWIVFGLTAVNFFILGTASFNAVHYMESKSFCGETCHSVMGPEFLAYQNSPHSRVECTACHVGPGGKWFIRSKLSGTRQLVELTLGTYNRPIPTPVKNLRTATETCEECHASQRYIGNKVVVRRAYADDEKNTRTFTVLLMHVGGPGPQGPVGIHGHHLRAGQRISYVAIDEKWESIPVVTVEDAKGNKVTYTSTDIQATPEQLEKGEHREMDCTDCHNRPTHIFELPEAAVDKQIALGHISSDLPFIKKKAIELIKAEYPDRDAAKQAIASGIDSYYKTSYADIYANKHDMVAQAGSAVTAIYLRNVYPALKLTWGTHPTKLGHMDSPGCFRCHDGSHTSKDGKTIANDCDLCHAMIAQDEEKPQVLVDAGLQ